MTWILLLLIVRMSHSDDPFLLQSFPKETSNVPSSFTTGPCVDPLKTLKFLQDDDENSWNHSECFHSADQAMLTCKLGLRVDPDSFDIDKYPLDTIKILVLFVQEFPENTIRVRVLDLCFLNQTKGSIEEVAICGYQPPVPKTGNYSYLHILDVPTLAGLVPNVHTVLISGINLWQSVEFRQMKSLKNLLIIQGATIPMRYFHSPHCADCESAHPNTEYSFHYLLGLAGRLDYYLYVSGYPSEPCAFDLLKKVHSVSPIPTLIVVSQNYQNNEEKPICDTCKSNLCPLLAVCLDEKSDDRRKKDEPFECLCIEEVNVEEEFQSCDPLTLHEPIYSRRCGIIPSFWNYLSLPIIITAIYFLCSFVTFVGSTIYLVVSK